MIQALKNKMLKMQAKRKILNAFVEAVEDAIYDSRQYGSSKGLSDAGMNSVLPMIIQSAVANTSQYLKEGMVGNFEISKREIDSLIDEAAKETMNKYFKSK